MSANTLQITFGGGLKVNADFKEFIIKTDQPTHAGGEGTAPAPFDLFLASIATCAGYYILVFCKERNLSTDNIGITMTTEKSPLSKMISKITIRIDLPSDFPEKYKAAIAKAADSCTVKAHLVKPPVFEVISERRPGDSTGGVS